MSSKAEKILTKCANFDKLAQESLVAEAKKKEKVDPKAKVRNRGNVCVPAEDAKDKKDHFPINDEGQARNALARVHQYSSVPEWYSGSLKGLQALVARKVKAKYPKIDVGGKKEKKADFDYLISKYAQGVPADPASAQALTDSARQSISVINSRKNLTPEQAEEQVREKEIWIGMQLANKPPTITQEQAATLYNAIKAKREELQAPAAPATPAAAKPASKPAPRGYGKIDPYVQKALKYLGYGSFLGTSGMGKDGVDGILGPGTRKAIEKFKSDRQMKGTDEDVFQLIGAEFKNKFPGLQFAYNDPRYSEKPVSDQN